ncbi:MAG: fibrillarin-like rRNA/tRNA 2'-O-methyltransferase [Candidatus Bathyarchaeia archaeon]
MRVEPVEGVEGVYWIVNHDRGGAARRLATVNLCPGRSVYGESLEHVGGVEYRIWDPYRSKLAAYIMKGAKRLPIKAGDRVLYLGAGSGTTPSHISDMVGVKGTVYCVEFSQRAMRELIERLSARVNVYPLLFDARFPERYSGFVRPVDGVYCDLAQPDQAHIMARNAEAYLKKSGWGLIAVKARSISVVAEPELIYRRELETLKSRGFKILDEKRLEPYEKDHLMAYCLFEA